MKKKVLFLSSIRSDYDIQAPIINAIKKSKKLDYALVVAGAHFDKKFGYTINEIVKDGFEIYKKIKNLTDNNGLRSRVISAHKLFYELIEVIEELKPDIVCVFGDREDAFMLAIAAAYMNCFIVHISAGDRVIGNIDDTVRHSISAISHLLLTFSEDSRHRLIRMGQQRWRVINTGNPRYDTLLSEKKVSLEYLSRKYKVDFCSSPYIIVLQHSLSSEYKQAGAQMRETLKAVSELKLPTLIIYPNNDPGSQQIIEEINKLVSLKFVAIAKNLPRVDFINFLRNAGVLVGNSSCGIFEAPLFKIPVINVGNRQKKRINAGNVAFTKHNSSAIKSKILFCLNNKAYSEKIKNCSSPFGKGRSARRIISILEKIDLSDKKWLIKDLTY